MHAARACLIRTHSMADGLDALLAEAANDKAARDQAMQRRTEAAQASAARAAARERLQASSAKAAAIVANSHTAQSYATMLKRYLEHLLDDTVLESIHAELSQRTYADVDTYYREREQLAAYTLESELGRMHYVVHTRSGATLTDTAAIRAEYLPCEGAFDATELLWRAANQSLFADLIAALQVSSQPSAHNAAACGP